MGQSIQIKGYPNTKITIKLPKVVYPIPRLVITDKIIGYTCQFIYGAEWDIEYDSIVVPVYRMDLEVKGKNTKHYGFTRDSWYSRGEIKSDWTDDDYELVNRCFEPAKGSVNLFSTVPLDYYGIDAFSLRQKVNEDSRLLNAEPHTEKMNTKVNGKFIDDHRKNLAIATGVMIHIGGYYHNVKYNKDKLGGSYGCFGFIPEHQMGSKSEMEEWKKSNSYEEAKVSNEEYDKFLKKVANYKGKQEAVHVLIKKRENVEKFRVLKNQ